MQQQTLQTQKHPRYRRRAMKDRLARYLVSLGGISVIGAILLIFFYLLYVVIPLFESAEVKQTAEYTIPGGGKSLYIGLEELGKITVRINDQGEVLFFRSADGSVVKREQLSLPAAITSVADNMEYVVLGLANGQALAVKYVFVASYQDRKSVV